MPIDADNPVMAEWTGPYGGVPAFDQVRVEHFVPALEAAMASMSAEIDAITANPESPTFENTLAALERAGRVLDRAETVFSVWGSSMSTDEFQAVEREMAPRMAAFYDGITQNQALFDRIRAVYESPVHASLSSEQKRLAWLVYTNFVRSGAALGAEAKERMAAVNQRLAELYTAFSQNVLADENDYTLELATEDELEGLPASLRAAAAAAGEAAGRPGTWIIRNTRSSVEPFLTFSTRRDLRERAWRMWVMRGDMGDEEDNNALITEIMALRAERATLLGYETHAHWRLERAMARTPGRAMELMEAMWTPAVAAVRTEVRDMLAIAGERDGLTALEPWDYRFYAEILRKERYDLDENEVKPYLQLESLREGMFWVAGELYGLEFEPADDVPVFHPDVRVWEARSGGRHVGLLYFDPFAREGKSSGAWMNAYRRQSRFDGRRTVIVSNNANFVRGAEGEPVLVSWSDATTLFHEFGHALHGLLSDVIYPSLSGTAVARDFVELPSQLSEHWLSTPEVLGRFATHVETGVPIPDDLVARIRRASTFRQGFDTVEFLASAIVDMKMHLAGDTPIDAKVFEREALAVLGMPNEIVMRHRLPHFAHVFAGDGYSAGYYSYLWADVLVADAWEAFLEAGGPYDREVAGRLREAILARGNTADPDEAWNEFRGRAADIAPLMRKRGFAAPLEPSS
jgi:peptidyl-dipeptidase Dcp